MSTYSNLIAKANGAGHPYLLIGGNAVNFFAYPRSTMDVDFLVNEVDLLKWKVFFKELGYQIFHEAHAFAQFAPSGEGLPDADIMIVSDETFQKLYASAITSEFNGQMIKLPSPIHLIGLKAHAWKYGAGRRGDVDFSDILGIMKACAISLEDPDLKAIIIRYGGITLYEKLSKNM